MFPSQPSAVFPRGEHGCQPPRVCPSVLCPHERIPEPCFTTKCNQYFDFENNNVTRITFHLLFQSELQWKSCSAERGVERGQGWKSSSLIRPPRQRRHGWPRGRNPVVGVSRARTAQSPGCSAQTVNHGTRHQARMTYRTVTNMTQQIRRKEGNLTTASRDDLGVDGSSGLRTNAKRPRTVPKGFLSAVRLRTQNDPVAFRLDVRQGLEAAALTSLQYVVSVHQIGRRSPLVELPSFLGRTESGAVGRSEESHDWLRPVKVGGG